MNKNKKNQKKKILLLILISFAILMNIFLYHNPLKKNSVPTENTRIIPPVTERKNITVGLPLKLLIPSLNINAAVEYVGQDESGTMEIPKSTTTVGWFNLGKRPGEIGTAVIAGHYGLYAGKPSVFNDLNKLTIGQKMYVQDDNDNTLTFVVQEIKTYDPLSNTLTIFNSDDEKSHLNLITCDGIWDSESKSYNKRLVVFTLRE
jgi:LPXTG-site transpeptidase (sortase) family protein